MFLHPLRNLQSLLVGEIPPLMMHGDQQWPFFFKILRFNISSSHPGSVQYMVLFRRKSILSTQPAGYLIFW